MTIQKTVTAKTIAANRANARCSTGPKNVGAIKNNALKHGLLSRHLHFESLEEKEEFGKLTSDLEREYEPRTATESTLVDEIALCIWKLQIANERERDEFANRNNAARAILGAFASNFDDDEHPLFKNDYGPGSAAQLGWECDELIIRNGSNRSDSDQVFSVDTSGRKAHVGIEARLKTSIETVLRYQAAIKRDLYRAVATLRNMKREEG